MLTAKHRAALKAECGVEHWHFEQYPGEAMFIPAGCPHQVRNLRPCIKARMACPPATGALSWRSMAHCRLWAVTQPYK